MPPHHARRNLAGPGTRRYPHRGASASLSSVPDVPTRDGVGGQPVAPVLLRALQGPRPRGLGRRAVSHPRRARAVRARPGRRAAL